MLPKMNILANVWYNIIVVDWVHNLPAISCAAIVMCRLLHEGFTNYSETLFTGYYYGTQAGNEYNIGSRKGIQNDISIIGAYGVNSEGSGDMYPKASAMIHMIRQIMKNDKKFRKLLMSLNKDFYHKIVTSAQIENYISQFAKKDFSIIYDQYLRLWCPLLKFL